ncbi:MAG: PHP domain-containing protein [Treponema sp.]|nr:PHP domain-containing protein [Treponema sp.]
MTDNLKILNDPFLSGDERLAALRTRQKAEVNRALSDNTGEINNHIHTIYSYSPYTPAMAAYKAWEAGLRAAGSVDHDSIAAADEMLAACAALGIGGCAGFEVRVSFKKDADGKASVFAARKINNPDSEGFAYMTVQGIPRPGIKKAAQFLAPIREERLKRTKAMALSANSLLREAGLSEIDFERDIYQISKYSEGGEITERHLLASIAQKIIHKYGKGPSLADGIKQKFGIAVSPKINALLSDNENPHYLYDLLGVLKTELLPSIFIQPGENECIGAQRVTSFASSIGAIPSYAYLGDVGESPTGDKKAEKFEDDFIEELFSELPRLGYKAVTYMPPRNTIRQLSNVQNLCRKHGFMEISGVDINSSRQSFNCPEVLKDECRHLVDTTWAVIAHERLSSINTRYGIFSADNPLASLDLNERLAAFAFFGKKLNMYNPDESAAQTACEIDKGNLNWRSV